MFDIFELGYKAALSLFSFINDDVVTVEDKQELSLKFPWHNSTGTMIIHDHLELVLEGDLTEADFY